MAPDPVGFVHLVRGVESAELSVRQHGYKDTVRLAVVLQAGLLKDPLHVLPWQVVVHIHLKVQLSEVDPEVVSVTVGPVPRVEAEAGVKVQMIEYDRLSSSLVVHVILVIIFMCRHRNS